MAAALRGRKAAYQRRRRLPQKRSRKIQTRRKKLRSRQKKKTRTRRVVRFARSHYPRKQNTTTRYFDRRLRNSVVSRQKTRCPARFYSRKSYRRKAQPVGRPRKQQQRSGVYHRYLPPGLKKTTRKKQVNPTRAAGVPKPRRKVRNNEDQIFYSMANTSASEGMPEERQSKKHGANPSSMRTKETELHSQEDALDNQPSTQLGAPKKRGRNSAAQAHKSQ